MNGRFLLYLLILLMVFFWSANFIIGKVALREFPAPLLGALRITLAGVLLAPVYWLKKRNAGAAAPGWRRRDLPLLAAVALCNSGNQILFLIGLSRTSVTHSALIIAMSPVFVLLIAGLWKLERITLQKSAGMAIAIGGVALLVGQARGRATGSQAGATLAGDLLVCLAAIGFAWFTVLGKRASARINALDVNTFAFSGSALALAPFVLWSLRANALEHVTASGWSSLIYMAAFPSVVCYLIYSYALARVPASRVSAFSYLQPPLAAALSVVFLGEHITPPLVAGGTVIFTGVVLTERA